MKNSLAAGRHLDALDPPREPFRLVRDHGGGVMTIHYFGEDAMDQWREAVREQEARAAIPLHVIAWADTEKDPL